jgi:hypothetical protein
MSQRTNKITMMVHTIFATMETSVPVRLT